MKHDLTNLPPDIPLNQIVEREERPYLYIRLRDYESVKKFADPGDGIQVTAYLHPHVDDIPKLIRMESNPPQAPVEKEGPTVKAAFDFVRRIASEGWWSRELSVAEYSELLDEHKSEADRILELIEKAPQTSPNEGLGKGQLKEIDHQLKERVYEIQRALGSVPANCRNFEIISEANRRALNEANVAWLRIGDLERLTLTTEPEAKQGSETKLDTGWDGICATCDTGLAGCPECQERREQADTNGSGSAEVNDFKGAK